MKRVGYLGEDEGIKGVGAGGEKNMDVGEGEMYMGDGSSREAVWKGKIINGTELERVARRLDFDSHDENESDDYGMDEEHDSMDEEYEGNEIFVLRVCKSQEQCRMGISEHALEKKFNVHH